MIFIDKCIDKCIDGGIDRGIDEDIDTGVDETRLRVCAIRNMLEPI